MRSNRRKCSNSKICGGIQYHYKPDPAPCELAVTRTTNNTSRTIPSVIPNVQPTQVQVDTRSLAQQLTRECNLEFVHNGELLNRYINDPASVSKRDVSECVAGIGMEPQYRETCEKFLKAHDPDRLRVVQSMWSDCDIYG